MVARMKCTTVGALLGAAVAVPTGLAAQDNCKFREEIELREPAGSQLRVDAGAGRLVIKGTDGINEIRVAATLCASDEGRLEDLDVTLRGDRLDTDYPSNRGGFSLFSGNRYARIDLVVEVPTGTNLRVDDSSGSVEITGTGDVNLQDGSGSMKIRGVGSVVIEDGSGSLDIREVSGDVEVEDGSGSMTIRDVTGDVTISDGSGSITVETVGGTVRMDHVGSGGVTVRDVDGDLVVRDGRRERIRYADIRGNLDLPRSRRGGDGG